METIRLDGRLLANHIYEQLRTEIKNLPHTPRLAVVRVGENPASTIYVNMKKKVADSIGLQTQIHNLPLFITTESLADFVHGLNNDSNIDGILVQLPLPSHIDTNTIIESIDPKKDVDGLTSKNQGGLLTGHPTLLPCTPLGCLRLIQQVKTDLSGLIAVVVGRSRLVGRPMAQILLDQNCTVAQAHTRTKDLVGLCSQADILVSATGVPGLIKKEHVKPGAIVIDVGISRTTDNHIAGDVDAASVQGTAGWLTPVPGGVGPMTVAMIMSNMVNIVKNQF